MPPAALETLLRAYAAENPADAARALEAPSASEAAALFEELPARVGGRMLERMSPRTDGRDPARSSSIFLTTVTDVVGFASFLGCAARFMPA